VTKSKEQILKLNVRLMEDEAICIISEL